MSSHRFERKSCPQRDNTGLGAKLELRRMTLRALGARKVVVFDACAGEQKLWSILRREFPVAYVGMDRKPASGRIAADSSRFVGLFAGVNFIDVDSYGAPWAWFMGFLPAVSERVAVCLTIGSGLRGHRGTLSNLEIRTLGFGNLKIPLVLRNKLAPFAIRHMLALPHSFGLKFCWYAEAENAMRTMLYVGMVLEPRRTARTCGAGGAMRKGETT